MLDDFMVRYAQRQNARKSKARVALESVREKMREKGVAYAKATYEGGTDEGYTNFSGFYDKDKKKLFVENPEQSWHKSDEEIALLKEVDAKLAASYGNEWANLAWLMTDLYFGGFSGAGDGSTYGGTLVFDVEKNEVREVSTFSTETIHHENTSEGGWS